MKKAKSRVKKTVAVTVGTVLVSFILIIVFISPLTKYFIEKYDVKLLGREVTMDWAYVNPFTGYIHFNDLKIFEPTGDSLFISAKGVSANLALHQLFSRTIVLEQVTIDHPWGKIVQSKDTINFSDIIDRFRPDSLSSGSGWRFTFLDTRIIEGEFHYIEKIIPINYFVRNVNIESTGKKWDADTIAAKFYFKEGKSTGDMKGDFTINTKNEDYRLAVKVNDFDLEIIRQYIWELINYGMFKARLDADIKAIGNFTSNDSISVKGQLALRDFHLGKTTEDDYVSFKKLQFAVEELSPVYHKYLFDSVILTDPFLKFERYDSLDNIQAMFGKRGQNISDVTQQPGRYNLVIEIAKYIEVLSKNFFKSDYKIGKLAVNNGDLLFNDYSLSEKFSIQANRVTIAADSINKNHKRVTVLFNSGLKPFGVAKVYMSVNPNDSSDFDLTYSFEKVPATLFNPYLISYTSFPIDRGTIEINGLWNVRNGAIKSTNHVVVIDPRVTKRIRNKDLDWIPMPWVMAFIRERGNVIDYEVPITGNLKDPKFHLKDIIFDVLENIFVKPATTPYRAEVKNIERDIEKALTVKWEMRQHKLRPHQQKFVKKISDFLKDNPEASLNVHPLEYASKEKEYILFYETKKKYFMLNDNKKGEQFSEKDSITVSKMSIKDEALVKFLSKNLSDTVMFTLQEKCINFVGSHLVNTHLNQLLKDREASFLELFKANGTDKQVKMYASVNDIPYNGFSYFKLVYPGEIPRSLQKAYEKMNDLNDESPRRKYLKQRKAETAIVGQATK